MGPGEQAGLETQRCHLHGTAQSAPIRGARQNALRRTNDFYIYKFDDLSDRVCDVYNSYISKSKKDGSPRKDVAFRWFDFSYMNDEDQARRNKWELLGFNMQKLA